MWYLFWDALYCCWCRAEGTERERSGRDRAAAACGAGRGAAGPAETELRPDPVLSGWGVCPAAHRRSIWTACSVY